MMTSAMYASSNILTHLKVCDHAKTSSSLGGNATDGAASCPCTISINLIQCRSPGKQHCAQNPMTQFVINLEALIPEMKHAFAEGRLPNTAATLARSLHASLSASSVGMHCLRRWEKEMQSP